MKKIEFDELQQSRRNKYGYQSFILLAVLIMLDSILYGIGFIWMEHPTNTFVILLIGFTYFISRCIWGDALVGPKDSPKRMTVKTMGIALLAAVISIVSVGYGLTHINLKPATDKGGNNLSLFCLIMWAILAIVYITKRFHDSKAEQ